MTILERGTMKSSDCPSTKLHHHHHHCHHHHHFHHHHHYLGGGEEVINGSLPLFPPLYHILSEGQGGLGLIPSAIPTFFSPQGLKATSKKPTFLLIPRQLQ